MQQLLVRHLNTAHLSMRDVTITCDPAAPEEPPLPVTVHVSDGQDYWGAWRLIAALQLPARLYIHGNVSLHGIPLPGPPSIVAVRHVWVSSPPATVAAGKLALLDFAFNYETVFVSNSAQVMGPAG